MLSEKLNEIKFHGNPLNTCPLTNSTIPNNKEKIKKELTTFFEKKNENKYVIKP